MPDHSIFHTIADLGSHPLCAQGIIFLAKWFPYVVVLFLIAFVISTKFQVISKRALFEIFFFAFVAYVAAELVKFFFPMPRPFVELSIAPLIEVNDPFGSFPSTHTAFFFALAAAMCRYRRLLGIGFFLAAFIIGIARIGASVHWPIDIVGGLLLGTFIGMLPSLLVKLRKSGVGRPVVAK